MSWRTVSVFVSSTFEDMHRERDVLRERVFPVIAERLEERRCHLEAVDLRWGIWTSEDTDETDRQMHVLSVCLDEIERCRPHFLTMLGSRYGWLPPRQVVEDVAEERGLELPDRPLSVTGLELEAAAFSPNPHARLVAFFCEDGAESADDRIRHLRDRLRRELPDRVFAYTRSDLEAFSEHALERLWTEIDAATAELAGSPPPTPLEDFIEDRSRGFTGRKCLIEFVEEVVDRGRQAVVPIVGPPGSGKSALFAHLMRVIEPGPERVVLGHSAAMGAGADQVDSMIRRFTAELVHHLLEPMEMAAVAEHFASDLREPELEGAVAALADWIVRKEAGAEQPGTAAIQLLARPAQDDALRLEHAVVFILRLATDVDRKLEHKVSLKARRLLLDGCLNTLARGIEEAVDETLGLRLAAARHRLSEVLRELGEEGDAEKELERTLAFAERDAEERPESVQALSNLARCHYNLGQLRIRTSVADALPSLETALSIIDRVAALEPEVPFHLSGVAAISMELGRALIGIGAIEEATELFEKAVNANETAIELEPANPGWPSDLATSRTAMALVLEKKGHLEEALAEHRKALETRDALYRRDLDNPMLLEALGISHYQVARLGNLSGHREMTEKHAREAVRIFGILRNLDSGNASWCELLDSAQALLEIGR